MNTALARRAHNDPDVLEVRPLTTADLGLLRGVQPTTDPIRRIRDRHHHIAWLIALGRSHTDIAAECRISPARISVLLNDPTFKELVEKRRAELNLMRAAHADDFISTTTEAMTLAESEVIRRIRSDPESVAIRDLNRISVDRMDRFGYGKHSTTENRNINVNFAAKLEAAIGRSQKVIEHELPLP